MRRICGLTQQELADILACARLTVFAIESGKLKLSESMAQRISLHTGVSQAWLLDKKNHLRPPCAREPDRPLTKEVYWATRAEVTAPRLHPLDVTFLKQVVKDYCARLRGLAREAYVKNDTVTFYMITRQFLEEHERKWKLREGPGVTEPVGFTEEEFDTLLEQERKAKEEAERAQKSPDGRK